MKITLIKLTFLLALTTSLPSFAFNEWSNGGCDSGDCQVSYCNHCECTDPGYGRNTCMSNSDYCEKFGNVGER
ncbi:MAG TPA: hypothetical protein VFU82_07210 [Gammaproteobacteria bacterium]|jgi:hypothetical protein|nr:hypothetical protein [Gammaproteobacteria bacterium]